MPVCVFSVWRFRHLHPWATTAALAVGSSPLWFASLLLLARKSSPVYLGRALWLWFSPVFSLFLSVKGEALGLLSEGEVRKVLRTKVVREAPVAGTVYVGALQNACSIGTRTDRLRGWPDVKG